MFNLLDQTNGMSKLMDEADNNINIIKSNTTFTTSNVLRKHKREADEKTKNSKTITVHLPKISTCSDAQDEVDCLNQYYQVAVGVKEGTTEAWLEIVGKDILDPVLRDQMGVARRESTIIGLVTWSKPPSAVPIIQRSPIHVGSIGGSAHDTV
jgi:hypothetical protein